MQWKISHKWATKPINCTLAGIMNGCNGGCCSSRNGTYWPGKSCGTLNGNCPNLADEGCKLGNKRPIKCLLYPFVLNDNNTLVVHHRSIMNGGCCSKTYKNDTIPII